MARGNTLEPNVQFDNGYAATMRNALRISDKLDQWPDTLLEIELELYMKVRSYGLEQLEKHKAVLWCYGYCRFGANAVLLAADSTFAEKLVAGNFALVI